MSCPVLGLLLFSFAFALRCGKFILAGIALACGVDTPPHFAILSVCFIISIWLKYNMAVRSYKQLSMILKLGFVLPEIHGADHYQQKYDKFIKQIHVESG
jgi:hypothetical protein